jgi:hypothetical protein
MMHQNSTIVYEWAKQLGGIAVSLEHRYFGESAPFGQVDSYTNSNIKFLSLENVMADAVSFMRFIQKTVAGAEESKPIVVSGKLS